MLILIARIYPVMINRMKEDTNASPFFRYLPDDTDDTTPFMVCTAAGFDKVKPGTVCLTEERDTLPGSMADNRVLSDFQINYITSGKGIYTSGGNTYHVKAGSILLLFPGIKHTYHPLIDTGWHNYWVRFNGSFFSSLMIKDVLSPKKVFFEPGLHDSIMSIYNLILEEVTNMRPLYQLRLCAAIISLVVEVLDRERNKTIPTYYETIVEKAKFLMEQNIFNSLNINTLEKQLGINPVHFQRYFKLSTSMSPYNYYINKKIMKAKSLLGEMNVSVKEAANQLGFDDEFYFSRLFKKKTGITPSKWKKNMNYRQVRGVKFIASNYGMAPFYKKPNFATVKDQDRQEVYYIEYAKDAIIETPYLGSVDPFWLMFDNPMDARGATRFTVDIKADNAEVLEDMETFILRICTGNGESAGLWDYDRTAVWKAFREKLIADGVTEFQTLEVHLSGPRDNVYNVTTDPLKDITQISLRFLTMSDEDLPGKVYFRDLLFYS